MAKLTQEQERFAHILLQTLSFFESYTLERLLIEVDQNFVEDHERLTLEDLEVVLKQLVRRGQVKMSSNDQGEKCYQRLYPKRSLLNKLKRWWVSRE